MRDYQVTLMCADGRYKPVSCIVKYKTIDLKNKEERKLLVVEGTKKICAKRYWGNAELKLYGYTKAKVRECPPSTSATH